MGLCHPIKLLSDFISNHFGRDPTFGECYSLSICNYFFLIIFLNSCSLNIIHLSRVMRKPTFYICENKDADQLRGNREADQRLCFRYIDSTIPLLSKSKISSLEPSSMAVQPGLYQTGWKPEPWFSHDAAQLLLQLHRNLMELINVFLKVQTLSYVVLCGEGNQRTRNNHRPWKSNHYPATCLYLGSNLGHSGDKPVLYH